MAVKRSAATATPGASARMGQAARSYSLDAFRGLAILAMVVDHLTVVFSGPHVLRLTVGRLAVPAFFILAGHLAGRLRWRHAWVAGVGLVLPLLVPWIDSPNVLLYWALGSCALVVLRWAEIPSWVLCVVALTLAANSWGVSPGNGYEWSALLGLMGLGAVVPRTAFAFAGRAPGWVAAVGRRPLTWYVGHLLVLQAVILMATNW